MARKLKQKDTPVITHIVTDKYGERTSKHSSFADAIEHLKDSAEYDDLSLGEYITEYAFEIYEVKATLLVEVETTVTIKVNGEEVRL